MRRFAKSSGLPGVAGYAMLALWFLLTVLAARSAHAAESTVLTAADILPEIEAALMARGISATASITLADPQAVLTISPGAAPQLEHMSYNPATGRFIARINGAAVAGIASVSEQYPVLLRDVARGDIIDEGDIGWMETSEARPGVIADIEALVGMEARRALQANSLLRESDVIAPVFVKRGSLVTITYAVTGLTLSETAVAQATGSKGDIIEVKNPKSDRVLRGVVDGRNHVRIPSSRVAQAEH